MPYSSTYRTGCTLIFLIVGTAYVLSLKKYEYCEFGGAETSLPGIQLSLGLGASWSTRGTYKSVYSAPYHLRIVVDNGNNQDTLLEEVIIRRESDGKQVFKANRNEFKIATLESGAKIYSYGGLNIPYEPLFAELRVSGHGIKLHMFRMPIRPVYRTEIRNRVIAKYTSI